MSNHPAPEPLTDEQLTKIVWKLAPSAHAEGALIRHVGQYEFAEPTHLLRGLARAIAAALASQEAHPARPSDIHSTESESGAVQRPADVKREAFEKAAAVCDRFAGGDEIAAMLATLIRSLKEPEATDGD